MTVFRADKTAAALFLAGLMAVAPVAAAQAQQAPEQDEQAPQEAERLPPAQAEPAEPTQQRRRFYLGPRLGQEPQEGAATAPPRSIIVGPYVPEGTIVLPELDAAQPGEEEALAGAAPEEADAALAEDITVDTLKALDPASIGVWEADAAGALPVDMWEGTPRGVIEALLPSLPMRSGSPVMKALARRLLLSPAAVPEERASSTVDLLAARLERLAAGGDLDGLLDLAERVPAEAESEAILRLKTDGLLVLGNYDAACQTARTAVARSGASYWLKIIAMCEALAGNRAAAYFRISLVDESGEAEPAFTAMVEALLTEIEGGEPALDEEVLATAEKLTPVLYALAQLTQAPIPGRLAVTAEPLVLGAVVESPNLAMPARLEAAETAARAGLIGGEQLAGIFSAVNFTPLERQSVLRFLETEQEPGTAAGSRGLAEEAAMSGLRLDALLFQLTAAAETATERTRWLGLAFARARERDLEIPIARAFLGPLATVPPGPETAFFADTAGRILLLAGEVEGAVAWYDAARAAGGEDAEATRALVELWPLMLVTDSSGAIPYSERILELWWQGRADLPQAERLNRGNLLFGILRELGHTVPRPLWHQVLAAPARQETVPPLALWRQLILAAVERRSGESVLVALNAMGTAGPGDVSVSLVSTAIAALRAVELEDAARRVALEALIGRGF